jgi:hypothetical protein
MDGLPARYKKKGGAFDRASIRDERKPGPFSPPPDYVHLPLEEASAAERKDAPIVSGFLDYFPDASLEVAMLSKIGNDQHNPGEPLHWARGKSGDEADTCVRHLMARGTRDKDGVRHSTKLAWRAMANLQKEIEAERADGKISRGSWP